MSPLFISLALLGANETIETHIHVIDIDRGKPVSGLEVHWGYDQPDRYFGTTDSYGRADGKLASNGYTVSRDQTVLGRGLKRLRIFVVSPYYELAHLSTEIHWASAADLRKGFVVQVKRKQVAQLSATRFVRGTPSVCGVDSCRTFCDFPVARTMYPVSHPYTATVNAYAPVACYVSRPIVAPICDVPPTASCVPCPASVSGSWYCK